MSHGNVVDLRYCYPGRRRGARVTDGCHPDPARRNRRRPAREGGRPLQHGQGISRWLVQWSVSALGGPVDFASDDGGTTVTVSFLPPTPDRRPPRRVPYVSVPHAHFKSRSGTGQPQTGRSHTTWIAMESDSRVALVGAAVLVVALALPGPPAAAGDGDDGLRVAAGDGRGEVEARSPETVEGRTDWGIVLIYAPGSSRLKSVPARIGEGALLRGISTDQTLRPRVYSDPVREEHAPMRREAGRDQRLWWPPETGLHLQSPQHLQSLQQP